MYTIFAWMQTYVYKDIYIQILYAYKTVCSFMIFHLSKILKEDFFPLAKLVRAWLSKGFATKFTCLDLVNDFLQESR